MTKGRNFHINREKLRKDRLFDKFPLSPPEYSDNILNKIFTNRKDCNRNKEFFKKRKVVLYECGENY